MRQGTAINHRERLNRVLLYIQKNLDRPLPLSQLAKIACLSPFHFHRIFSAFSGETLTGYVRRLRLERAAARITLPGSTITETALAVGYGTPAAFARAFRKQFGVSPSKFRYQQSATGPYPGNAPPTDHSAINPEIRTASPAKVS